MANANADGYTDSGTVSGDSETTITASCTASAGMGGAGGMGGMGAAGANGAGGAVGADGPAAGGGK